MISHATIIGRAHRLMQHNCQDFALAGAPAPEVAFGLVCDGCGSKYQSNGRFISSRNEVGAALLGQFTADFLNQRLATWTQPASPARLEALLADLHLAAVVFLGHLAAQFPESTRPQLIGTQLLATLLGFIRTPEAAVFFWHGDGLLAVNGQVCRLDVGNQPDYLAYHLLQPSLEKTNFQLAFVPQPKEVCWLAVASDGWSVAQLRQLSQPRTMLALQRWLNLAARQRDLFNDDGAVAMWFQAGAG